MTDTTTKVREHYGAMGLTDRIKSALATLAPEGQTLTVVQSAFLSRPCALFDAKRNSTLLFSSNSALFTPKHRGWWYLCDCDFFLAGPCQPTRASLPTLPFATFNFRSKIPTLAGLSASSGHLFRGSQNPDHAPPRHLPNSLPVPKPCIGRTIGAGSSFRQSTRRSQFRRFRICGRRARWVSFLVVGSSSGRASPFFVPTNN